MRKPDAVLARTLANNNAPTADMRERASRELVCLALILAVGVLLWRIASMW